VLGYNALNRGNKGVMGKLNRFAHQLHAYFLTGAPPARAKGNPVKAASAKPVAKATPLAKPAVVESR
jgi:biopolymer transport protein ExbB